MKKYIAKAAIKYQNKIYTGFDHGECFKKLERDNHIIIFADIEQGFITSNGAFVDRKEAIQIAKKACQLNYETDKQTLISEDLFLDWLNRQDKIINKQNKQIKKYDEFCKFVGESLFDEDDEFWGYEEFYCRKLKKLGYIKEKNGYYVPAFKFDSLCQCHVTQRKKPLSRLIQDIDAELYNNMVIKNKELKYSDIKLILDKIAKRYGGYKNI